VAAVVLVAMVTLAAALQPALVVTGAPVLSFVVAADVDHLLRTGASAPFGGSSQPSSMHGVHKEEEHT